MKHTITSNLEVNDLFMNAPRSTRKNLIVLCSAEAEGDGSAGRVAYLAGKRLGSAPRRSRAKRVLREAARKEGAPWQGLRVVLVAREAIYQASMGDICSDISSALKALAPDREVRRNSPSQGQAGSGSNG